MAIRSIIVSGLLLLAFADKVVAVSLTATPSVTGVKQPVTYVIGTSFTKAPANRCSITIDFGDQTRKTGIDLGAVTDGTSGLHYIQSVTHSYQQSGTFTTTAEVVGCRTDPPLGANPATTKVSVTGFNITRLELAFADGKGQTTLRRNELGVRGKATIATEGSGLLQGYWEVDGRLLLPVEQYLTFAQTISIMTPETPPLPTFDVGDHLLRFVVTSPVVQFSLPTLVYTVTAEEGSPIQLQSPLPQTLLPFTPTRFSWHAQSEFGHYELKIYSQEGQLVFAAITKVPKYQLTRLALQKYFTPATSYVWQVVAYDKDGRPAGSSLFEPFSFMGVEKTPR